ncbi:hypothetical protein [Nitratireductor indicus]|uniref:CoxF protein n=1 Tax=Nitratireductor indicus C115 TaxID=1231190 RepID=K2P1T3_9HYPH|nr:hypothetical protein [Nitratireductor indicus]EKF41341.1 hypothetical protein NA8A_15856 [Nitratireductor indicus C115]MDS1138504.1 hypothetical protein [Nitratireductor indicus]SFQ72675.1 hypothetical protein SAMN05216176_111137 [Nitratireductor indicus]
MEQEFIKPTEAQLKARRKRSIAIAIALVAFVIVVYIGSLVKLGPSLFDRAM